MKKTLQKQAKLLQPKPLQEAGVVDSYTRQLNDIERLVKQHTDAQIVQAQRQSAETVQPDQDPAKQLKQVQQVLQKGLLDKTGDGANSNVIKMTKLLQTSLQSSKAAPTYQPNQDRRGSAGTAGTVAKPVAKDEQVKQQVGKYSRGLADSVKDIKNIFTVKGFFDVENASGILGDVIKKKVARDEYVAQQQAMNPTASGDPAKDKARFAKQFEVVNKYRGQAKQATEQIEKYRESGATEQQIARTEAAKSLEQAIARIAIADPLYRERQPAAPVNQPAAPVNQPAAPVNQPAVVPAGQTSNVISIFSKSKAGLVGGEVVQQTIPTTSSAKESESENLRLMQQQTAILSKIEENTRGLLGAAPRADKQPEQLTAPEQQGGGLLSDIAGVALDSIGGGKRTSARGARGLGGKALKFLGGKGGAIAGSALAVGAGAYTAYEGWQTAGQNQENASKEIDAQVAAGTITAEQGEVQKAQIEKAANVEKGGAVGEGGGMAAGAIGGGIAGAKLGGAVGAMFGGVGAVPGALIGGALGSAAGAVAGSSVGKAIGGTLVSGYQAVKGALTTPVVPAPLVNSAARDSTTSKLQASGIITQPGTAGMLVTPSLATAVSAPPPAAADAVYNRSGENAAAVAQPQSSGAPVVINAPSNSTSTQNTIYSPKPVSRNSDSTMKNYIASRYAF